MIKLHIAQNTDFDSIRDIYYHLIDSARGRNDTVLWKKGIYPSDEFLKSSIEKEELLVFTADTAYIGCLILNRNQESGYKNVTWNISDESDKVAVIHGFCVDPNFHRQGYGKKIVNLTLDYAKSKGFKTLRLDILENNIGAEKLYLSCGFSYVDTITMNYPDTGNSRFKLYEIIM